MTQTTPAADNGNESETPDEQFQLHDDMEFRAANITSDESDDDYPVSSTFQLVAANDGSVTIRSVHGDAIIGIIDVTQLEGEAREQVEDIIDPEVRDAHRDNPDFPFPDPSSL